MPRCSTRALGVYQTKWFFARAIKSCSASSCAAGVNEDPCEVYFSDYRTVDGRQLPHRIQVYYSDVHYGTFTVTSYKLAGELMNSPTLCDRRAFAR